MSSKLHILRWSGSLIAISALAGACSSIKGKPPEQQQPVAQTATAETEQEQAQQKQAQLQANAETQANAEAETLKQNPANAAKLSCTNKIQNTLTQMGGTVNFATNQSTIDETAQQQLAEIGQALATDSSLNVKVAGFTDSTGSESFNLDLSDERANAVKNVLVQNGANPDQVQVAGHGESMPVASNDTTTGRSENRRAQVSLITSSTA